MQGPSHIRKMLAAAATLLAGVAGLAATHAPPVSAQPAAPEPLVILVEVRDAIGPATREHFLRALKAAGQRNATLVVLALDTPGGLDVAMRDMIQGILASPVPVVTYVSPAGARAASAGTFLLYASHFAAMAPGTNLGAATPVSIGGGTPAPPARAEGKEPTPPADAGSQKALNDSIAYLVGLAKLRGRNEQFAEAAIREAASLPAQDALAQDVVDILASDLPDLLRQLDGRTFTINDREGQLATDGLVIEKFERDWRTDLLAVITNPLIAYGLLLVGIYGLMFEGYNPGALVPGVLGAVALLLGLYALQVLSVNFAGLALLGLGLALMIAELFVPSFGALGLGGLAAFVFGSIMLLDSDAPGYTVNVGLVAAIATAGGLAIFGTVWLAMKARQKPVISGTESMSGALAQVVTEIAGSGTVRHDGELWQAVSQHRIPAGATVRVTRIDGLTLHVDPVASEEPSP